MRQTVLLIMLVLTWTTTSDADMGFDPRYERDYNIFTPTSRYAPDNPLNLVNAYDPTNPFNPHQSVRFRQSGQPHQPIQSEQPVQSGESVSSGQSIEPD